MPWAALRAGTLRLYALGRSAAGTLRLHALGRSAGRHSKATCPGPLRGQASWAICGCPLRGRLPSRLHGRLAKPIRWRFLFATRTIS